MSDFSSILRHERRERRLGYLEAAGILLVIGLIIATWVVYL